LARLLSNLQDQRSIFSRVKSMGLGETTELSSILYFLLIISILL